MVRWQWAPKANFRVEVLKMTDLNKYPVCEAPDLASVWHGHPHREVESRPYVGDQPEVFSGDHGSDLPKEAPLDRSERLLELSMRILQIRGTSAAACFKEAETLITKCDAAAGVGKGSDGD
jgi:hypothetical protein